MIRLRLLLLLAGAGTLLAGLPAGAAPSTGTAIAAAGEAQALTLLTAAATAARARTYSGTQYVSTWQGSTASSHIADVRHTPSGGSVVDVRPAGSAGDITLSTDLDVRLLRLLASHYELAVAADQTCTGRTAHVVEARRPDGAVAGRFWVDADTDLVLRRELFDPAGRLMRSSAFASLTVAPGVVAVPAAEQPQLDVAELRAAGWQVPDDLPGELELYDARVRTHDGHDVLHLAYSDGLSTVSLFAQRGRLGTEPIRGLAKRQVGQAQVWFGAQTAPQRVVWGGDGRVFTLLADAPPDAVRQVVQALPHDAAPHTGFFARLGRGLSRLASWLNPFD